MLNNITQAILWGCGCGQLSSTACLAFSLLRGYNEAVPPPTQAGYVGPVKLAGALNAPLDPVNGQNTYLGYKFFSFSQAPTYSLGVAACTAACTAQTAYNSRHPPCPPMKPAVCNQVVVYVLSDADMPEGVYCAMYNEEWAPQYATNMGQWRGSEFWAVDQAYAYTNSTYADGYEPICAVEGCPEGSYGGGNCGGWGAGAC